MTDKTIPIRLSHLLRHCSVGAVVRGPKYLMTVEDIRHWYPGGRVPEGSFIHYVNQVRSALGIKQELCMPPIAKINNEGKIEGTWVPAVRFPTWMRCLQCGLMYQKPWEHTEWDESGDFRCKCQEIPVKLEQVYLILVHEDGRMADVPWHFLAHKDLPNNEQKSCRVESKPYLYLKDENYKRVIRCRKCKAKNELKDSIRIPFGVNTRKQPWIPNKQLEKSLEESGEKSEEKLAWLLEINDARVHMSVTRTALIIPPESRIRKGTVVDHLYCHSSMQREIIEAKNDISRNIILRRIVKKIGCSISDVENALDKIQKGYPLYDQLALTPGLLLVSEYRALIDEIPNLMDDEDFVTEHHTTAWKNKVRSGSRERTVTDIVSRLVAVNRLKEIVVLEGFRRINNQGITVPPDIEGKSDWLPAIELYGEGIFFTLDETMLQSWETQPALQERAEKLQRRIAQHGENFENEIDVSPRFLLLHTLAHIIIRGLEAEVGYPAASLKERIYCKTGAEPMAGILIYVGVPDRVGSLGGLMELAGPRRFRHLLSNAFDRARWCSLDPVCSEHEGQGPALLNRAACHACVLVPETSCIYKNILLDRTLIKGDSQTGISPLLESIR